MQSFLRFRLFNCGLIFWVAGAFSMSPETASIRWMGPILQRCFIRGSYIISVEESIDRWSQTGQNTVCRWLNLPNFSSCSTGNWSSMTNHCAQATHLTMNHIKRRLIKVPLNARYNALFLPVSGWHVPSWPATSTPTTARFQPKCLNIVAQPEFRSEPT